jgi:hypothetical protein
MKPEMKPQIRKERVNRNGQTEMGEQEWVSAGTAAAKGWLSRPTSPVKLSNAGMEAGR